MYSYSSFNIVLLTAFLLQSQSSASQNDSCVLDSGTEIDDRFVEGLIFSDVRRLLPQCRENSMLLCRADGENGKERKKRNRMCLLQFMEECACNDNIETSEWLYYLLKCPKRLLQMQTPECLSEKLCYALKQNMTAHNAYLRKFGIGNELHICKGLEDGNEIVRKKRQAAPPLGTKLLCANFTNTPGHTYSPSFLSTIDISVFRDCPKSLAARNYTVDQLIAIGNQAATSLGDPCRWTEDSVVNLTVIILGLNETTLKCIPLVNTATFTAIGKSLYFIPMTDTKIGIVYGRYRSKIASNSLTSLDVANLQGLTCGFTNADLDNMTSAELSKSIATFALFNCYKPEVLRKIYNLTLTTNGAAINWTTATIKTLGTILAGVPLDILKLYDSNRISNITPAAVAIFRSDVFNAFSLAQISAMTPDQLVAIPQNCLANLTADRRDLIVSILRKDPMTTMFSSPRPSDTPPKSLPPAGTNLAALMTTTNMASNPNNSPAVTQNNGAATGGQSGSAAAVTQSGGEAATTQTSGGGATQDDAVITQVQKDSTDNSDDAETTVASVTTTTRGQMTTTRASQVNPGLITQAPLPNNWDSITVPPVIDASNIQQFLSNLALKMSTDDVQKIDPNALSNPAVLDSLMKNDLDMSMKQALADKIGDMLSKKAFDPVLYVKSMEFLSPKSINSLNNDQIMRIFNQDNFVPNPDLLSTLGAKAANLLINDPSKLSSMKQVIAGMSPTSFEAVLDKQKITADFLKNFNGTVLTEKQSRDLYNKYMNDNQVNFTIMSSGNLSSIIASLPSSICQALKVKDLQNLNADSSYNVLQKMSDSVNDTQDVDPVAVDGPILPSFYLLYEKMKSGNIKSPPEKLISLIKIGLLSPKTAKDSGTDFCFVISSNKIWTKNCLVMSIIINNCQSQLASYCKSTLVSGSGGFLTTADVEAMDGQVMLDLCLTTVCPLDNKAKLDGIVSAIEALIIKKKDIMVSSPMVSAALPYLQNSTLDIVKDPLKIRDICRAMSCQSAGALPYSLVSQKIDYCISKNISLRILSCQGSDLSFFFSYTKANIFMSNMSCDLIKPNLDVLQRSVIDCSARAAIYNCVQSMDFTTGTNVAKLGSLIDQTSDADFAKIPKKFLCGFLTKLSKLHDLWSSISEARTDSGFKPINLCSRNDIYKRLIAADSSAECTGTTKRKRDTTASLTCSAIKQMRGSANTLTTDQISTLSKDEFSNCADVLGKVKGFSLAQWQALAVIAKNAYGTDTSTWTTERLTTAAGIVSGLSVSDINNLNLNQLEAISAIGSNGFWTDDTLQAVYVNVKMDLLNNNLASVSSTQLSSMHEIICGATATELATITVAAACDSHQNLGKLQECIDAQLTSLATLVKDDTCLKSTPTSWDMMSLGNLIGGLSKDDLSKLSNVQIQNIPPAAIAFIPAMQFNGFTVAQLQQFSQVQAAKVSSSQLNSLDADKQKVIKDKLSALGAEISLSLATDNHNNNAGLFFSSTLLLAATILLSFLLKI